MGGPAAAGGRGRETGEAGKREERRRVSAGSRIDLFLEMASRLFAAPLRNQAVCRTRDSSRPAPPGRPGQSLFFPAVSRRPTDVATPFGMLHPPRTRQRAYAARDAPRKRRRGVGGGGERATRSMVPTLFSRATGSRLILRPRISFARLFGSSRRRRDRWGTLAGT